MRGEHSGPQKGKRTAKRGKPLLSRWHWPQSVEPGNVAEGASADQFLARTVLMLAVLSALHFNDILSITIQYRSQSFECAAPGPKLCAKRRC